MAGTAARRAAGRHLRSVQISEHIAKCRANPKCFNPTLVFCFLLLKLLLCKMLDRGIFYRWMWLERILATRRPRQKTLGPSPPVLFPCADGRVPGPMGACDDPPRRFHSATVWPLQGRSGQHSVYGSTQKSAC